MGATSTMGVRFSQEERAWVSEYAAFKGVSISEAIRESVFEAIEDELDARTYADAINRADERTFGLLEVIAELGDA